VTTNRKAIPLARSIFIAPGTGSDVTGNGTAALPFATWHTGAWPLIASLTHTDVAVTYTTATPDTSPTGTYVLPTGVRVTLSGPWSVLLTDTAHAGSTKTDLVTSGGLVVNPQSGRRIRWTSGTNFNAAGTGGNVYSALRNTTTDIVPSRAGFFAVPGVGDGFVVEQQVGGWAPGATFTLDSSAPGSAWFFAGFLIAPSAFVSVQLTNGVFRAAGLYFKRAGTFARFLVNGTTSLWGTLDGSAATPSSPLGSPNRLCCYIEGNAGTGGGMTTTGGIYQAIDTVYQESGATHLDDQVQYNGVDLHGTGTGAVLNFTPVCQALLLALVQQGASTHPPVAIAGPASVELSGCAFDTTLAADAITAINARLFVTNCTGANATAGKFGLNATVGTVVTNAGGNTVAGGAGAIKLGAHAAQATWPAAGTLVTDLADASSQACVQS
jgi:hypothetical protein